MLSPEQINEIHRLHLVEKWPQRRIARHLHIGRHTLAKYLDTPAPSPSHRDRTSKLDVFKPAIAELLQQDPKAPAQVLFQRLQTIGYDGGITILKDYLQAVRKNDVLRRAYVRMEPSPGERFDIDWGHFGALSYNGTPRKLYAFCLVECHSRKMYLEFTHSQSFETFVRYHMHAFQILGGCARELWFDNLATAVAEHEGNLVRFNPRFLAFAREYISSRAPAMLPRPGRKVKSNVPSDMCARTSGHCARSPISATSTRKRADGSRKSPTDASTARQARLRMIVSSPRHCGPCHYSRQTIVILPKPSCTKISD
jgi:transposase